jgi:hypothetical protein
MRRTHVAGLMGLAVCLVFSAAAFAGKINAADYPLRVHIFSRSEVNHYYYGSMSHADGQGRANLFENSQPTGFDFSYNCGRPLQVSPGGETYMARWKKQGSELEILLPVFGKPDAMDACNLKVIMKDGMAYYKGANGVSEEPSATFKAWMVKHQYDPEHGMNEPIRVPQPAAAAQPAAPPAQQ